LTIPAGVVRQPRRKALKDCPALSWRAWNSFSARTCTDLGGWTRRRSNRLLSGEIEWVKVRIDKAVASGSL
jgi:hypothetical protein